VCNAVLTEQAVVPKVASDILNFRFNRVIDAQHKLISILINMPHEYSYLRFSLHSFFLFFFFLIWGGTRSIRMPALRLASQAGEMRNPRETSSIVLRDTIRLT